MAQDTTVLRTLSYWKQYFANDRKQLSILGMVAFDQKWGDEHRISYNDLLSAMNLKSNKCLHDTGAILGKRS